MSFEWRKSYIGFLNMSHRLDRREHFVNEIYKLAGPVSNGTVPYLDVHRTRGMRPEEFNLADPKVQVMLKRTPGAIGCHYGQVEIMEKAYDDMKDAMVFEDDVVFCSDIQKRLDYIQDFLNKNEWDIFWLGATFHIGPAWWHTGGNPDLPDEMGKGLGRDAECTDDPRIMRTYGAFSTHAYIVNKDSIDKVLKLLDENLHLSMGIDWIMIKIQPQLKCFSFVPGCVKQMDNMSDIGGGMTVYSGFSRLNGNEENSRYWWQDKMDDFDPLTFDWKEALPAGFKTDC